MDRQLGQDAPPPESLHKYVRGPGNSTEVSGYNSSSLGGSVVMQAAARRAVGVLFVGGTLTYDPGRHSPTSYLTYHILTSLNVDVFICEALRINGFP